MVCMKDGSGMLSPDCYYEDRTLFLSPAVSALLILWNWNHNVRPFSSKQVSMANHTMDKHIAQCLLQNNEQKQWRDPSTFVSSTPDSSLSELAKQDDETFKMACLINCGTFRNVIIEDFLKGILGLANIGYNAGLDLFKVNPIALCSGLPLIMFHIVEICLSQWGQESRTYIWCQIQSSLQCM
jgi:linoleate 10R-lipoxygenase